jgi:hypothetical protein
MIMHVAWFLCVCVSLVSVCVFCLCECVCNCVCVLVLGCSVVQFCVVVVVVCGDTCHETTQSIPIQKNIPIKR